MDEILRNAALAGSIDALYASIQNNALVLELIDQKPFVDTPLHLAAAAGHVEFAMEMMILKPSFARKLNQEGFSPIHLSVENGHQELAVQFMEHDKNLVRVKGKHGKTPVHHAIARGENHLLAKFLEACPECIRDMTTKNQTALHIATENNGLEALQLLCRMLRKSDYCRDVANQKDVYGDTALHVAARNNQPEMLKLLLKCKADKYATNQAGSMALDVAHERESINILRGWRCARVSRFREKIRKPMVKHVMKASEVIFNGIDNISSDDRNALLVVLGLLLTATYQASISPPGSVWQGDPSSNSTSIEGYGETGVPGKSVMDEIDFLSFYIPAYTVFIVTLFLTLGLLKPFPRGFRTALQVLLSFLAISFDQSVSFIAPTELTLFILGIFAVLVFIFMMVMCVAYRVSKLSVLILGLWFAPGLFGPFLIGTFLIVGCWLFLSLYDTFWIGSILLLGSILVINEFFGFALLGVIIPVFVLVLALFLHYIEVIQ